MNPNAISPWQPAPELVAHIDRLIFEQRLSDVARSYLKQALSLGPSRTVQGRLGNVRTKFYSRKLRTNMLLESRTGEFAQGVLLEHDADVMAYLAQPPKVHLEVKNEAGLVTTVLDYTPDFLVIRRERFSVIETRDDRELLRRTIKNRHQFYQDADGQWHYRAAEEFFQSIGLEYTLLANSRFPAVLIGNIRFLEDYVGEACPPPCPSQVTAMMSYLQERRFASLLTLLDAGFEADTVFKCITSQDLFFDLAGTRLDATDEVVVFADPETQRTHALIAEATKQPPLPIPGSMHLRPGTRVRMDGAMLVVQVVGEREVVVVDEMSNTLRLSIDALWQAQLHNIAAIDNVLEGTGTRQLASCTPAELERAEVRLRALREGNQQGLSCRTLSRYNALVAGTTNELDALLVLVDRAAERGNRKAKISEVNIGLIERAIKEHYNTPKQPRKKGAFKVYLEACAPAVEPTGQPVRPVSYQTFCRYCDALKDTRERLGKRAAYQTAEINTLVTNDFPVHGARPHDVCYVDHTVANLATASPNGMGLGKPTLTLAVDGHTAMPRALILSYDPPSTRTVMLVLRDYLRRHQRLPRVLCLDNGKEFHSHELDLLCRLYGIDLRYRPPGMPRGGAMIERLIGASEEEVLSEMEGNTRCLKKDTRLVTKSIDPFRRAEWTLPAAYGAFQAYLFEERPNRVHPALGVTPAAFEQRRFEETGHREHRMFSLDENFMLLTSPHPRRPFHKLHGQRGIWVDGVWYRHPDMRKVRPSQLVEVRIEPWNASIVYVRLEGRWVAAVGRDSRWIANRTRREVEVALRQEAKLSKTEAAKGTLGRSKSAQRMWGPQMFDERLAVQQQEMLYLYEQLGLTTAMPVAKHDSTATASTSLTFAVEPGGHGSSLAPSAPSQETADEAEVVAVEVCATAQENAMELEPQTDSQPSTSLLFGVFK